MYRSGSIKQHLHPILFVTIVIHAATNLIFDPQVELNLNLVLVVEIEQSF
jgi:hypothetical protein